MSEADAILDGGEPLGSPMDAASHELPQDWEFAERILKRLNPRNQQDVYDMAARDSKNGGMLITLMVVVWWLFIGNNGDDVSVGVSVFFGLNFEQAALAVMVLSLFSALLTEFSRDMGKILPSTAAGGMLILAGLYVAEPLVGALFVSSSDLGWLNLGNGACYCAKRNRGQIFRFFGLNNACWYFAWIYLSYSG